MGLGWHLVLLRNAILGEVGINTPSLGVNCLTQESQIRWGGG